MKEVKGMMISEGVTYTGEVMSDGYQDVPHGMGMMKYTDHNELGRFQGGELNGVAYLNYHEYMYVGTVHDGLINGWGLKAERGGFTFGVFESSKIKVNLTPLVNVLWSKAMEEAGHFNRSATYVRKSGEVFVGAPQYLLYGEFGFHFLGNGEVFVGRKEYDEKGITGKFLHFDSEFNITKGEYKEGDLVREIDDSEFVSACEVFVDHKYIDFDINMNYNPDNFLFNEKKLLHVVEAGKTPSNIILKANFGRVIGNRFECLGDVNEDTVWFMFPNDDGYLEDRLMDIVNGDNPWMPDFSEYSVEFYNDFREANNDHQVVYKHISCYDADADYELDVFDYEFSADDDEEDEDFEMNGENALVLIPNFAYKQSQLVEQWRNNTWYYTYPSVRDYVESLAEGDDVENFFGWLFDDARFNNTTVWTLPGNYEDAYQQFLNLFPSI